MRARRVAGACSDGTDEIGNITTEIRTTARTTEIIGTATAEIVMADTDTAEPGGETSVPVPEVVIHIVMIDRERLEFKECLSRITD